VNALRRWGRALALAALAAAHLGAVAVGALSVRERTPPALAGGAVVAREPLLLSYDAGAWSLYKPAEDETPARPVLLVHGLDEPGDVWDDLAPRLERAGRPPLRFEYPNDQAAARSGDLLIDALGRLGAAGVDRLDIVAHSMGGLLSRDALTRPGIDRGGWPAIDALVMVATPHKGSAWAPLRAVAEIRDRGQRFAEGSLTIDEAMQLAADGDGAAGRDLTPGSRYLAELNARPNPENVRLVCIVGRWMPAWADALGENTLGDGVVTVESATLEGADEVIEIRGNHRAMLRAMRLLGDTTAVPAVLEALRLSDQPQTTPTGDSQ